MSAAAPGDGGRVAPRSIFYGGRSRRCVFATATLARTLARTLAPTLARARCVFATPTEHSGGPTIDTGPDGRSPGTLAKLRCDWVE